jgi:hypothetical protein
VYVAYPLLYYLSIASLVESVCPLLLLLFSTKLFDYFLVPILSDNETKIDGLLTKSTRLGVRVVRGVLNRGRKMVMREVADILTNTND